MPIYSDPGRSTPDFIEQLNQLLRGGPIKARQPVISPSDYSKDNTGVIFYNQTTGQEELFSMGFGRQNEVGERSVEMNLEGSSITGKEVFSAYMVVTPKADISGPSVEVVTPMQNLANLMAESFQKDASNRARTGQPPEIGQIKSIFMTMMSGYNAQQANEKGPVPPVRFVPSGTPEVRERVENSLIPVYTGGIRQHSSAAQYEKSATIELINSMIENSAPLIVTEKNKRGKTQPRTLENTTISPIFKTLHDLGATMGIKPQIQFSGVGTFNTLKLSGKESTNIGRQEAHPMVRALEETERITHEVFQQRVFKVVRAGRTFIPVPPGATPARPGTTSQPGSPSIPGTPGYWVGRGEEKKYVRGTRGVRSRQAILGQKEILETRPQLYRPPTWALTDQYTEELLGQSAETHIYEPKKLWGPERREQLRQRGSKWSPLKPVPIDDPSSSNYRTSSATRIGGTTSYDAKLRTTLIANITGIPGGGIVDNQDNWIWGAHTNDRFDIGVKSIYDLINGKVELNFDRSKNKTGVLDTHSNETIVYGTITKNGKENSLAAKKPAGGTIFSGFSMTIPMYVNSMTGEGQIEFGANSIDTTEKQKELEAKYPGLEIVRRATTEILLEARGNSVNAVGDKTLGLKFMPVSSGHDIHQGINLETGIMESIKREVMTMPEWQVRDKGILRIDAMTSEAKSVPLLLSMAFGSMSRGKQKEFLKKWDDTQGTNQNNRLEDLIDMPEITNKSTNLVNIDELIRTYTSGEKTSLQFFAEYTTNILEKNEIGSKENNESLKSFGIGNWEGEVQTDSLSAESYLFQKDSFINSLMSNNALSEAAATREWHRTHSQWVDMQETLSPTPGVILAAGEPMPGFKNRTHRANTYQPDTASEEFKELHRQADKDADEISIFGKTMLQDGTDDDILAASKEYDRLLVNFQSKYAVDEKGRGVGIAGPIQAFQTVKGLVVRHLQPSTIEAPGVGKEIASSEMFTAIGNMDKNLARALGLRTGTKEEIERDQDTNPWTGKQYPSSGGQSPVARAWSGIYKYLSLRNDQTLGREIDTSQSEGSNVFVINEETAKEIHSRMNEVTSLLKSDKHQDAFDKLKQIMVEATGSQDVLTKIQYWKSFKTYTPSLTDIETIGYEQFGEDVSRQKQMTAAAITKMLEGFDNNNIDERISNAEEVWKPLTSNLNKVFSAGGAAIKKMLGMHMTGTSVLKYTDMNQLGINESYVPAKHLKRMLTRLASAEADNLNLINTEDSKDRSNFIRRAVRSAEVLQNEQGYLPVVFHRSPQDTNQARLMHVLSREELIRRKIMLPDQKDVGYINAAAGEWFVGDSDGDPGSWRVIAFWNREGKISEQGKELTNAIWMQQGGNDPRETTKIIKDGIRKKLNQPILMKLFSAMEKSDVAYNESVYTSAHKTRQLSNREIIDQQNLIRNSKNNMGVVYNVRRALLSAATVLGRTSEQSQMISENTATEYLGSIDLKAGNASALIERIAKARFEVTSSGKLQLRTGSTTYDETSGQPNTYAIDPSFDINSSSNWGSFARKQAERASGTTYVGGKTVQLSSPESMADLFSTSEKQREEILSGLNAFMEANRGSTLRDATLKVISPLLEEGGKDFFKTPYGLAMMSVGLSHTFTSTQDDILEELSRTVFTEESDKFNKGNLIAAEMITNFQKGGSTKGPYGVYGLAMLDFLDNFTDKDTMGQTGTGSFVVNAIKNIKARVQGVFTPESKAETDINKIKTGKYYVSASRLFYLAHPEAGQKYNQTQDAFDAAVWTKLNSGVNEESPFKSTPTRWTEAGDWFESQYISEQRVNTSRGSHAYEFMVKTGAIKYEKSGRPLALKAEHEMEQGTLVLPSLADTLGFKRNQRGEEIGIMVSELKFFKDKDKLAAAKMQLSASVMNLRKAARTYHDVNKDIVSDSSGEQSDFVKYMNLAIAEGNMEDIGIDNIQKFQTYLSDDKTIFAQLIVGENKQKWDFDPKNLPVHLEGNVTVTTTALKMDAIERTFNEGANLAIATFQDKGNVSLDTLILGAGINNRNNLEDNKSARTFINRFKRIRAFLGNQRRENVRKNLSQYDSDEEIVEIPTDIEQAQNLVETRVSPSQITPAQVSAQRETREIVEKLSRQEAYDKYAASIERSMVPEFATSMPLEERKRILEEIKTNEAAFRSIPEGKLTVKRLDKGTNQVVLDTNGDPIKEGEPVLVHKGEMVTNKGKTGKLNSNQVITAGKDLRVIPEDKLGMKRLANGTTNSNYDENFDYDEEPSLMDKGLALMQSPVTKAIDLAKNVIGKVAKSFRGNLETIPLESDYAVISSPYIGDSLNGITRQSMPRHPWVSGSRSFQSAPIISQSAETDLVARGAIYRKFRGRKAQIEGERKTREDQMAAITRFRGITPQPVNTDDLQTGETGGTERNYNRAQTPQAVLTANMISANRMADQAPAMIAGLRRNLGIAADDTTTSVIGTLSERIKSDPMSAEGLFKGTNILENSTNIRSTYVKGIRAFGEIGADSSKVDIGTENNLAQLQKTFDARTPGTQGNDFKQLFEATSVGKSGVSGLTNEQIVTMSENLELLGKAFNVTNEQIENTVKLKGEELDAYTANAKALENVIKVRELQGEAGSAFGIPATKEEYEAQTKQIHAQAGINKEMEKDIPPIGGVGERGTGIKGGGNKGMDAISGFFGEFLGGFNMFYLERVKNVGSKAQMQGYGEFLEQQSATTMASIGAFGSGVALPANYEERSKKTMAMGGNAIYRGTQALFGSANLTPLTDLTGAAASGITAGLLTTFVAKAASKQAAFFGMDAAGKLGDGALLEGAAATSKLMGGIAAIATKAIWPIAAVATGISLFSAYYQYSSDPNSTQAQTAAHYNAATQYGAQAQDPNKNWAVKAVSNVKNITENISGGWKDFWSFDGEEGSRFRDYAEAVSKIQATQQQVPYSYTYKGIEQSGMRLGTVYSEKAPTYINIPTADMPGFIAGQMTPLGPFKDIPVQVAAQYISQAKSSSDYTHKPMDMDAVADQAKLAMAGRTYEELAMVQQAMLGIMPTEGDKNTRAAELAANLSKGNQDIENWQLAGGKAALGSNIQGWTQLISGMKYTEPQITSWMTQIGQLSSDTKLQNMQLQKAANAAMQYSLGQPVTWDINEQIAPRVEETITSGSSVITSGSSVTTYYTPPNQYGQNVSMDRNGNPIKPLYAPITIPLSEEARRRKRTAALFAPAPTPYTDEEYAQTQKTGQITAWTESARQMMYNKGMPLLEAQALANKFSGSTQTQSYFEGVIGGDPFFRSAGAEALGMSQYVIAGKNAAGAYDGSSLYERSFWQGAKTPMETIARIFGPASTAISSPDLAGAIGGTISASWNAKTKLGGMQALEDRNSVYQWQSTMAQWANQQKSMNIESAFTTGVGLGAYKTVSPVTGQAFNIPEGGEWGLQDRQMQLGFAKQEWSFGMQEKQMALQSQQFYQNSDMQRQQSMMQRGWTQEDWAYNSQTRAMQWGWKQEDYQENARFTSGRERRLSERGMQRETIMYNLEGEQIDKQKERQTEMWRLEDARFKVEKSQFETNKKLQQEEFTQNKKFYAEEKKLQLESQQLQRAQYVENKKAQQEALNSQIYYGTKIHENDLLMRGLAADSKIAKDESDLYFKTHELWYKSLTLQADKFFGLINSAMGGKKPDTSKYPTNKMDKLEGNADGGNVMGNVPVIVGERGPEIFVPGTFGTIIPNNQIQNTWNNSTITGTTQGTSTNKTNVIVYIGNKQIQDFIVDTISNDIR